MRAEAVIEPSARANLVLAGRCPWPGGAAGRPPPPTQKRAGRATGAGASRRETARIRDAPRIRHARHGQSRSVGVGVGGGAAVEEVGEGAVRRGLEGAVDHAGEAAARVPVTRRTRGSRAGHALSPPALLRRARGGGRRGQCTRWTKDSKQGDERGGGGGPASHKHAYARHARARHAHVAAAGPSNVAAVARISGARARRPLGPCPWRGPAMMHTPPCTRPHTASACARWCPWRGPARVHTTACTRTARAPPQPGEKEAVNGVGVGWGGGWVGGGGAPPERGGQSRGPVQLPQPQTVKTAASALRQL